MIFGRAGGPANITVSDQSVSKRHARIFQKDGQWFLEDLKSVNGTVVNNRRITEAVQVTPGFMFALSKHQFEIVTADGAISSPGTRSAGNGRANGESDPRRGGGGGGGRSAPLPAGRSSRSPAAPTGSVDPEPLLPPEPTARSRSAAAPALASDRDDDEPVDEAGEGGGGASAVMAALPRAIAYYLAAIPLMALNPLGTVRRGIEEQKVKAMGPIELIAFFLPVQLFANLAGAWAAALGLLIGGGGFVVGLFFPVVQIVIAVVVSVVMGLVWHPLTRFFIDRLFKGESNERSRTNYAVMMQTAAALLAVPGALTALSTPIIARLAAKVSIFGLLHLIPALLAAIVAPLTVYIAWQWMKAFNVLAIIQKILMVLFILSIVGGVFSALAGVKLAVSFLRNGSSTSTATTVDAGTVAGVGDPSANPGSNPVDNAAPDAGPVASVGGDPPPPNPNPNPNPIQNVDRPANPPDPPVGNPPARIDEAPKGGYGEYKFKREAIEKAFSDDPSLMLNGKTRAKYLRLLEVTSTAKEEAVRELAKNEKDWKVIVDRVKEAKVYAATKTLVDELAKEVVKK